MSEAWAWISGWGVAPERFHAAVCAALPGREHLVVPPTETAVTAVLNSGAMHVAGYSLGSLLLMCAADRIPAGVSVHCLAPIVAFCEGAECGGLTPASGVDMLAKRMEQSPSKALKLFYRLAGLNDEPSEVLPYAVDELQWGLSALRDLQADLSLLRGVRAVIGSRDPLLDSGVLRHYFDGSTELDVGHGYVDLLEGMRR